MKKSLIALAVMGASSVAFAASNVTLYGVVDAGAVVSKVKHNTTKVQMKSGFDSGSRWGLKGVEELGNGYSVGFQLEQGFDVDTGSNTASNSEGNSVVNLAFLFLATSVSLDLAVLALSVAEQVPTQFSKVGLLELLTKTKAPGLVSQNLTAV